MVVRSVEGGHGAIPGLEVMLLAKAIKLGALSD